MTALRRAALPVAAGVAAAAATFAVVLTLSPDRPAAPTAPRSEAAQGRAVFAAMGCGSCHRLRAAGSDGQIGPSLDAALPGHTRGSLRAKIVRPGRDSIMPSYGERLSRAQLRALVAFLVSAR